MLKGIAASAGISIARVYKLEAPKVEIVKKEGDPAAEVEKFNAALEKTKKDIEGVKERAAKTSVRRGTGGIRCAPDDGRRP